MAYIHNATREEFVKAAAERGCPERTASALYTWQKHAVNGGGFLTAILRNNLADAYFRGDAGNRAALGAIVEVIWHDMVSDCHDLASSDHEKTQSWKGLDGGRLRKGGRVVGELNEKEPTELSTAIEVMCKNCFDSYLEKTGGHEEGSFSCEPTS